MPLLRLDRGSLPIPERYSLALPEGVVWLLPPQAASLCGCGRDGGDCVDAGSSMALIVTSCTMGSQPDRLLNKGAKYFRDRTNSKLFAHRRRSAVELLEASRDQYVKSGVAPHSSSKSTDNLHRLGRGNSLTNGTKRPTRCKSEYDMVKLLRSGELGQEEVDGNAAGSHPDPGQADAPQVEGLPSTSPPPQKINTPDSSNETAVSSVRERICALEVHGSRTPPPGSPPQTACPHTQPHPAGSEMEEVEEEVTAHLADRTVVTVPNRNSDIPMPSAVAALMEGVRSQVHRSQSEMSCCQHSLEDPHGSEHPIRFTGRASANLEKFFNEMGLEKSVLDPILRRQEMATQRDMELFESVSSLDSPDNRSICSGLSRSEKNFSDLETSDRVLQQTSVVERNARIIKWLCNVKKSKHPPTPLHRASPR